MEPAVLVVHNACQRHIIECLSLIREVNMSNRRAHRSHKLTPHRDQMTTSQASAQRTDANLGRLLTMALFGILFFSVFCGADTPLAHAQARRPAPAGDAGKSGGDVARGKYLVESVAMCGQCHTPRDSSGNLDLSKWLQGAPIPWAPSMPNSNWPLVAPRIGGNPPASDADMVKLLTTGIWTTGKPLRFPMMPFRMSAADARAVVAYLKSLTPQN